ncbi:MAG: glycosyltransferase [Acidobacteria bacterium]|nr:glycosyltransferase [Acidobacteriota bacterium]
MTTRPRLSVVVPVYNELATFGELLDRVQRVDMDKELVLVDDCSQDGTRERLQKMAEAIEAGESEFAFDPEVTPLKLGRVQVFFQDRNRGKGAALRRGFEVAAGEIIVIQDADLEYDPEDCHRLIRPIEAGKADIVYGSRFSGSGGHRVLYYWHSLGNKFLTWLSNMLSDLNLTDAWTCYKMFRREVLDHLDLTEDRFGFEVEFTAQVAKARPRLRIYEVGVDYHGRTYGEGKKITWHDGYKALWQTFKHNVLR